MKKERIIIPLDKLQLNQGQVSWLGENPRQWTQGDIDKTVNSLKRDPDYIEERPLLVIPAPQKGEFVVFAGNLRFTAAGICGWKDIHCVVHIPENETDRETVRRRSILDNGTFGNWNVDVVSSGKWAKYSADELTGFGVPGYVIVGSAPAAPATPPQSGEFKVPGNLLPEELQGLDLTPDKLEKLKGTDQVAMERIIIVFPANRTAELAALLGLPSFDKVVYKIDELPAAAAQ